MSHGGTGGGRHKEAEPNLVPLLDMVLQLIMFFVLCANFVMDQINEDIKLPQATTAKSLDRTETDLIYLNVNDKGALLPYDEDREPITSPQYITRYLARKYKYRMDTGGEAEAKKTLVIIRADAHATFDSVYRVMKAVKQAGFQRLQLRAMIK
jgi:biopolymer transport protein ExbD